MRIQYSAQERCATRRVANYVHELGKPGIDAIICVLHCGHRLVRAKATQKPPDLITVEGAAYPAPERRSRCATLGEWCPWARRIASAISSFLISNLRRRAQDAASSRASIRSATNHAAAYSQPPSGPAAQQSMESYYNLSESGSEELARLHFTTPGGEFLGLRVSCLHSLVVGSYRSH